MPYDDCARCEELLEAQKWATQMYLAATSRISGTMGDDLKLALNRAEWWFRHVREVNRELTAHFEEKHGISLGFGAGG